MPESETTNPTQNSNLPLNQDPSSVYCIHPSNTNSTQIVCVKFNGSAFND